MNKKAILTCMLISLGIAVFLSPFASGWPDGLEKVAEDKGFIHLGEEAIPAIISLVPDYAWPGIKNERAATAAAGFVGTLVMCGLGYAVGYLLTPKIS